MQVEDYGQFALEVLTLAVVWILVPLIMVGLVVMARSLLHRSKHEERRTAARAGWWAGMVLFFVYFLAGLPSFRTPVPGEPITLGIGIWPLVIGVALGFAALWATGRFAPNRVIGFVVLLLTFAGLAVFHTYVFIDATTEPFLSVLLGAALGALLHMMVFPDAMGDLLGEGEEGGEEYYVPPGRR